jgi:membrane-bound lytic murein transglycosylase F
MIRNNTTPRQFWFGPAVALFAAACLCLQTSCGKNEPGSTDRSTGVSKPGLTSESAEDAPVSRSDLDEIRERGALRILVRRARDQGLPRAGSPPYQHEKYAEKFAKSLGIDAEFVYVDDVAHLIPALAAGKGDMIAANLTITRDRQSRVSFTMPLGEVIEQLVAKKDDSSIKSVDDLGGKTLGVAQLTSFWDTAQALKERIPKLKIKALRGNNTTDDLLDLVAQGKIDATILDSNIMEDALGYRQDIRVAGDASEVRSIGWAVRKENPALLEALDQFVAVEKVAYRKLSTYIEDLPGIKKRGVLRVLTRNSGATYFLWRGELLGYEYEMVRHFAEGHGLEVEMVVAPTREDLIPMLKDGKGDLIAAFLTISDERRAQGVEFSPRYNKASEMVVAKSSEEGLAGIGDLAGRTITVRKSSSYWSTLQELLAQGHSLTVEEAPEDMETEEIMARVADGAYDLTVADSHLVDLELAWRDDLRACFAVKEEVEHGWAVRAENTALQGAVNDFWKKEYRGLLANMTYNKYFKSSKEMTKHHEGRVDGGKGAELSPYDHKVQPIASEHKIDWRLITSQMYQESRFDPNAKSFAGALGLMQVMPRTAKEMGYTKLHDPEIGIRAGVEYLDWTWNRYDEAIDVRDRYWFALAAYNAGIGHVADARRLADQKGWDRNLWFENVEKAMLLLAKPEYANKAKYGYVRGQEPVNYVREIRDRYQIYVTLADRVPTGES